MNIYALSFVVGGLVGALAVYWFLRLRSTPTPKAKRPHTEKLAKDPHQAELREAAQVEAADLNARRLQVEAQIRDQRTATRARRASERNAAEESARVEAERLAAEDAARIEAERLAAEEAARVEAQRVAAEESERIEAERLAAEEAARVEAQRVAAEEAARADVERLAAEEAARAEAQRVVAEEAAHIEAERLAADEAARADVERLAAEEAARVEAQRLAAAQDAEAAAAKLVVTKSPADTLVMIVDDSKVGRVKTNRVLLNHQFQSQMAEDGRDAVKKITERMPDIIITDVEMPEMDGFELTQYIRQNPATAHIPVIIISGNKDEYADRAKEVGADFILGKPYTDSDLLEQVQLYMRSGR